MKRIVAVAAILLAAQSVFAGVHRLGGGVNYNLSAKNLIETGSFNADKLSFLVSYQFVPPVFPVKFQGDVEIYPTGAGTVIIPQAHALLGGLIYCGLGIGVPYADGKFGDPLYNVRLGTDIPLSSLHLDINANYKFTDFDQLGSFNTDLITLGVVGRYEF